MSGYSNEASILARVYDGVTMAPGQRDITTAAIPNMVFLPIAHC